MRDFHKLKVWERAHNLTLTIYETTKEFPNKELYGLTSQMRMAAASMPTNIAEGCGRESKSETIQFLNMATGSASELEYQLILTRDLHYLDGESYSALISELTDVKRMLYSYIQRLQTDIS